MIIDEGEIRDFPRFFLRPDFASHKVQKAAFCGLTHADDISEQRIPSSSRKPCLFPRLPPV